MGLLNFVKSAGAKMFGATETAAAPPEQWKQEAEKHGLDRSRVETKSEADKVVHSGSASRAFAAACNPIWNCSTSARCSTTSA